MKEELDALEKKYNLGDCSITKGKESSRVQMAI
jgi:hypothetical protein